MVFGIYCKIFDLMTVFVATIRKRGWHMFTQGFDKVDDSETLSALTGAYADLGAHKRGAYVFFGVFAPFADEVYLTGSFNSWNGGVSLSKMDGGIWQTGIEADSVSDGDRYKFKAIVGGEEVYLQDPYAEENDGDPYFNSVYRERRSGNHGKCNCYGGPLTVYEIESDRWLCYDGRANIDYETLSRELIPYLLQMGYTHVSVSGACNQAQGGAEAFAKFIGALHTAGLGVFIRASFDSSEKCGADGVIAGLADTESFGGLVHKIDIEGLDASELVKDSAAYRNDFTYAPEDMRIRRNAAALCYLLFKDGRMLTKMGCETGREDAIDVFDRHSFESEKSARFQLFASELNHVYLSNPEIWQGTPICESENYRVRITGRCAEDFEMVQVTDLSGNGGIARVFAQGDWRIILDSSSLLGYESAEMTRENDRIIRIRMPQYGAVLLERIK